VGVSLAYVTARGHSLIGRELYLPLDWCEDRGRCRAAHIRELVHFQTKPELAIKMLGRIEEVGSPITSVVADMVFSGNLDLRTWLEAHGYPYVLSLVPYSPQWFSPCDRYVMAKRRIVMAL
jgi:SRSO17 transposase